MSLSVKHKRLTKWPLVTEVFLFHMQGISRDEISKR